VRRLGPADVEMKTGDDDSKQLVSQARTSLVFILRATCPSWPFWDLSVETQSPLPSRSMDRGIHPSPSPPACCIPVNQAPLLSLGSILTYDLVRNNTKYQILVLHAVNRR